MVGPLLAVHDGGENAQASDGDGTPQVLVQDESLVLELVG